MDMPIFDHAVLTSHKSATVSTYVYINIKPFWKISINVYDRLTRTRNMKIHMLVR